MNRAGALRGRRPAPGFPGAGIGASLRTRWLPIILVLAWTGGPARAADRTTILFPPDLTLSPEAKITIHAFREGKDAALPVFVNGKPAGRLEGQAFRRGDVLLSPGLNRIRAGPKTVRVYHLPRGAGDRLSLPAGKGGRPLLFRAYRPHPALDDGCEGCHLLQDGRLRVREQKEACYACHDDFGKPKNGEPPHLHQPVADGECTSCHAPHYSALPKLQKDARGCIACHDPYPARGSVHRPARSGACTACHDPHAGVAPKQLVRPGNDLCTGCHADVHLHHRGAAVTGSMTVLPPDVPRDGRSLSCLACHASHQSPEGPLLLMAREALCRKCHPR